MVWKVRKQFVYCYPIYWFWCSDHCNQCRFLGMLAVLCCYGILMYGLSCCPCNQGSGLRFKGREVLVTEKWAKRVTKYIFIIGGSLSCLLGGQLQNLSIYWSASKQRYFKMNRGMIYNVYLYINVLSIMKCWYESFFIASDTHWKGKHCSGMLLCWFSWGLLFCRAASKVQLLLIVFYYNNMFNSIITWYLGTSHLTVILCQLPLCNDEKVCHNNVYNLYYPPCAIYIL